MGTGENGERLSVALRCLVCVVAVGCGGRSISKGDAGDARAADSDADAAGEVLGPPPDEDFAALLQDFCAFKAGSVCALRWRCGEADAEADECLAAEKARCLAPVVEWQQAAVREGRLAFDPTKVELCLATLQASCAYVTRDPPVCKETLVGLLAPGQPCRPDHERECQSGACAVPAGDLPTACGATCTALGKAGAPCAGGYDGCDNAAFWCTTLVPHHCEPKRAAGAPCDNDDQCANGLSCAGGACRSPGIVMGGECPLDLGCARGMACLPIGIGGGLGLGVCGDRVSYGDGCTGDVCAETGYCELGATGSGICRRAPENGEPCGAIPCFPGSACSNQVCHQRPWRGDSCADGLGPCWGVDVVCGLALGKEAVCMALPAIDTPCAPACGAASYCSRGSCRPLEALDEACQRDTDCESGRCACRDGTRCAQKACAPGCVTGSL